jgi:hypothetical protein
MQFAEYRDFLPGLRALYKRGGRYQKAADQINALMGRAGHSDEPLHGLRPTKHGESRIKGCIKYDLNDFCRLITVQRDGYCVLLYCGDHEDCDRWLEANRGLTAIVGEDHAARVTFVSTVDAGGPLDLERGHALGPLYERLPGELFDRLMEGVPRRVARQLEGVESTAQQIDLWQIVGPIEDSDLRIAVCDVFMLLRGDKVSEAIARTRLYLGDVEAIDSVPEAALPDVVDSEVIRHIDPTSERYGEALQRFMKTAKYRDWMLFMHPAQERIVDEDFDGPAKLVGVSGSGKTCVVVQRAVRLARQYEGERVLILTLNRALAQLINDLVTSCTPPDVRGRIDVKPFFSLCRELMLRFDPSGHKLYDEVTWKSNEHVDEVW